MNKVIEVDIYKEEDLYEKYNRNYISKGLINYIIEEAMDTNKDNSIKIVINNKIKDKDIRELITNGLKKEYDDIKLEHKHINHIQIIYLIVGMFVLSLSFIMDSEVFREVISIGGWVLIWQVFELEISTDISGRRRRKVINKLLNSEIIENKILGGK